MEFVHAEIGVLHEMEVSFLFSFDLRSAWEMGRLCIKGKFFCFREWFINGMAFLKDGWVD